uniref:CDK5 regulatory subunit associated protein 1-like 1 n=1 Tax=Mus spicilegus TaxID=10103 RepID=A0A8C6GE37_MUSSI
MPSAACDVLLDDIEDIISQEDSKPQDRQFSRKHVFPKVRRRNTQKYLQEELRPPSDSTIPGIQKIWIRTWGCSHNNSDGEYMAGQLAAYGYKITDRDSLGIFTIFKGVSEFSSSWFWVLVLKTLIICLK